jgi:D-alanine-D-alanine ligase
MELAPDAAFICLHGPGGEDGTVQALLETLDVSYTGSGPLSSIRCMDKDYAKRALRAAGIQSPPSRTFLRKAMNEMGASAALDVAAEDLGYPLVVKPAREGSSFGLSRVEGPDGLLDAVYEALGYDAKILLESGPLPVYETSRVSRSACTVPSSPPGPCRQMKAASGASSMSVPVVWSSMSRG